MARKNKQKDEIPEVISASDAAADDSHEMVLIKAHEFVHISNNVSITQRKLMNVLLYNAYDSLLTQEEHTILLPTLVELMGYETNNYDFLKEAFRGLVDLKFEWNLLENNKIDVWGVATAIAQAEIDGNLCRYSYAPKVREKMYNPDIYALIDLSVQGKFGKNGYALALYENCLRFRSQKKTIFFSLPLLKKLLGVAENAYVNDFKSFNRDVIKTSIATVNEVGNILLKSEFQRENRKVVAVQFIITEKFVALPSDLTSSDADPVIVSMLREYGLSEKSAKTEASMHSEEYIKSVLRYVDSKVAVNKVDDIPAYTVKALKEGWMMNETKFSKAKREKETFEKETRVYEREMQKIKEAFSEFRKSRIAQIREDLSSEMTESLDREFVSTLLPHELDTLKRSGLGSAIIQSRFNHFIAGKYLTKPEEIDLEAFVKYSKFEMPKQPVAPIAKTRRKAIEKGQGSLL